MDYARPSNAQWTDSKIPSRQDIQKSNILAGNELVWLGDPFEVYIVHVQGSAKIRMPGGEIEGIGYSAHNGWEYQSIMKIMIAEGKLSDKNINIKAMIDYFKAHPDEVDMYVNKNPRFVFFNLKQASPEVRSTNRLHPLERLQRIRLFIPGRCLLLLLLILPGP